MLISLHVFNVHYSRRQTIYYFVWLCTIWPTSCGFTKTGYSFANHHHVTSSNFHLIHSSSEQKQKVDLWFMFMWMIFTKCKSDVNTGYRKYEKSTKNVFINYASHYVSIDCLSPQFEDIRMFLKKPMKSFRPHCTLATDYCGSIEILRNTLKEILSGTIIFETFPRS